MTKTRPLRIPALPLNARRPDLPSHLAFRPGELGRIVVAFAKITNLTVSTATKRLTTMGAFGHEPLLHNALNEYAKRIGGRESFLLACEGAAQIRRQLEDERGVGFRGVEFLAILRAALAPGNDARINLKREMKDLGIDPSDYEWSSELALTA